MVLDDLGAGNLGARVGSGVRGELATLARAVDDMAGRFQVRVRDLEDAVLEANELGQAAAEGEARYRALMEQIVDGILITDSGGRIVVANVAVCALLGYTAEELADMRQPDVLEPDVSAAPLQLEGELLSKRDFCQETRLRRKDGTFVPVDVSLTVLSDGSHQLILRDITERRQAERQRESLAQSEKLRALGQMATGIAHDLNQSLMLVASYSELAQQALNHEPPHLGELRELFTTATQAALDGGETVKRLLLFTRATREKERQPVNLSSVIRDAMQLTAPRWRDAAQAEGRPITLRVEAQGHPTIEGSPARIREMMTNLIFNAIDALPTGGTIRLRAAADHGQGIVEVIDSGVGMSPEVQTRVFEPFFTTKGEAGTGLGLAMVFGIVEQHGGHIEVQSRLGSGTTFRITFPLGDPPSAEVEPSPGSTVQMEPQRPLRVLAVDDEPMMTKAVVRMLRPSGHLVSVAASGEEALEQLATRTFDVVVSDMGMGAGMNGWELADAVKRQWPEVRFLLATGWGAAIDPTEAHAKGVESVLAKPYRLADLEQALAAS
jgi:PAS domain S-box-containing protein